MISSWLSNTKVQNSIVEYKGYTFLIATNSVGSHRIALVEELKSGIREIPNENRRIESGSDLDNYARELMDKIIVNNFAEDV